MGAVGQLGACGLSLEDFIIFGVYLYIRIKAQFRLFLLRRWCSRRRGGAACGSSCASVQTFMFAHARCAISLLGDPPLCGLWPLQFPLLRSQAASASLRSLSVLQLPAAGMAPPFSFSRCLPNIPPYPPSSSLLLYGFVCAHLRRKCFPTWGRAAVWETWRP